MRIIGEMGCNWDSIKEAKQMIRLAQDSGCFGAKFQLFTMKMAKKAKIPPHLALSFGEANDLFKFGKHLKESFPVFFTPMSIKAFDWCESIGVDYIKIRHMDNNNREFYLRTKKMHKFTFISINSTNEMWRNFVDYKRGAFLYCVPKYPAKYIDYDIGINILDHYNGISDHTPSLRLLKEFNKNFNDDFYFEKHLCIDKDCLEADWSITFEELKLVLKNGI